MNDVKKCSISGIAFTLETDAYDCLAGYLESLRTKYTSSEEGEEIIADIEARIAELILSAQDNSRTVALPLIKNIIAQLGSVEEIEEEPETTEKQAPRIPRRLYRDPDTAKLGGVCAGLGRYFSVDPVWIRLGLFLPLILSWMGHIPFLGWCNPFMGNLFGIFVFGYLIMWFVVPVARTARQKLEMEGEAVTVQNIDNRTSSRNDVDGHSKQVVANTVSGFGLVILILLKIVAGLLVTGLMIAACTMIIALFVMPALPIPELPSLLVVELGILVALAPVMLLIYVLMCLIASRRPSGKVTLIVFILWLLLVMGLCVSAIRELNHEQQFFELPAPSHDSRNLLHEEPLESLESLEGPEGVDSLASITFSDGKENITIRIAKEN